MGPQGSSFIVFPCFFKNIIFILEKNYPKGTDADHKDPKGLHRLKFFLKDEIK